MTEQEARDELVRTARSLFERGYSVGSAGNLSVKLSDGYLITPTNSSMGTVEPDQISKLDLQGNHLSGNLPSKELPLHMAFYETRPQAGAVVHLHSTFATALSCLEDVQPDDCIPAITPYVVMRVGRVKLVPYFTPGDPVGGKLIRELNGEVGAVLLANHGPVTTGRDLRSAVFAAEELEETAKLLIVLKGQSVRTLNPAQIAELNAKFG